LQIAWYVANDEAYQNCASHSHHDFLADDRTPEGHLGMRGKYSAGVLAGGLIP